MNSVQILGNLARDPEVRFTKTGRAVATFTVAATNTYIDSTTNETKEQTAFINCVAWGKLGEAAGNLRKGQSLLCRRSLANSFLRDSGWSKTLRY